MTEFILARVRWTSLPATSTMYGAATIRLRKSLTQANRLSFGRDIKKAVGQRSSDSLRQIKWSRNLTASCFDSAQHDMDKEVPGGAPASGGLCVVSLSQEAPHSRALSHPFPP